MALRRRLRAVRQRHPWLTSKKLHHPLVVWSRPSYSKQTRGYPRHGLAGNSVNVAGFVYAKRVTQINGRSKYPVTDVCLYKRYRPFRRYN